MTKPEKHKYRPFTTRCGSQACAECYGNEHAEQHTAAEDASFELPDQLFGELWRAADRLRWCLHGFRECFDADDHDSGCAIAEFDRLSEQIPCHLRTAKAD